MGKPPKFHILEIGTMIGQQKYKPYTILFPKTRIFGERGFFSKKFFLFPIKKRIGGAFFGVKSPSKKNGIPYKIFKILKGKT